MFVVDLIAASLLAIVLTVVFTAVIRRGGYLRLRDFSAPLWLMMLASWIGGVAIVAFGVALTGNHWLPFTTTALLVGLLVLGWQKMPNFRYWLQAGTRRPGSDARPLIALYFVATLLLFFCAISLRFYLANLA